jgi:hypothetical protein
MTARGSASDSQRRAGETAARAAREHAAIVAAVHMLEKALASRAIGREAGLETERRSRGA